MLRPLPITAIERKRRDEDVDCVITPDGRKVAYDNYVQRYQAQSDADRTLADDLIAAAPTFAQRMAAEAAPEWKAASEWARNNQRDLPQMHREQRIEWLKSHVEKLKGYKDNPRIPAYEHKRIDRWIGEAETELRELEREK